MEISKKIIISIFLIFIIFNLFFCNQARIFAADFGSKITDISDGTTSSARSETKITNFFGAVITILKVAGIGIAIAALIFLGIRYVTGSVMMRAEFKKELPMYIMGVVFIFAAVGILTILENFITKNFD